MSLTTMADITDDERLRRRIIAAAALDGEPNPDQWVYAKRWELASLPTWISGYDLVREAGDPGENPNGITDQMIKMAVTNIRFADATKPEGESS